MNNLIDLLDSKKEVLNGRLALGAEILLLREKFKEIGSIDMLLYIIENYRIIGHTFKVRPEEDVSGTGVAMDWLSPSAQIEEAFQFYPGIIVVKKGYFPVGACLYGSGDPYFLKNDDGVWNLYRVLHDISDEIFVPEMVEFIISFQDMIKGVSKHN